MQLTLPFNCPGCEGRVDTDPLSVLEPMCSVHRAVYPGVPDDDIRAAVERGRAEAEEFMRQQRQAVSRMLVDPTLY